MASKNAGSHSRVKGLARLAGKFKSRFTSSEIVVLSDEEDEVVKEKEQEVVPVVDHSPCNPMLSELASKINSFDVKDDWAIRDFIQSTCEGVDDWDWDFPPYEKPDRPVGETSQPLTTKPHLTSEFQSLDIIYKCHHLGFDYVNAKEKYHSGKYSDDETDGENGSFGVRDGYISSSSSSDEDFNVDKGDLGNKGKGKANESNKFKPHVEFA